jgi:hypothetical protein
MSNTNANKYAAGTARTLGHNNPSPTHQPSRLADVAWGAIAGIAAGIATNIAISAVGVVIGVLNGTPQELLVGLIAAAVVGNIVATVIGATCGAVIGALLAITRTQHHAPVVGTALGLLAALGVISVMFLDSRSVIAALGSVAAILVLPSIGVAAGLLFLRLRRSGSRGLRAAA